MREKVISFETSKFLKEKGFDVYTRYRYTVDDDIFDEGELFEPEECSCDSESNRCFCGSAEQIQYFHKCNPAPTQSLLQTWLREKHQIIITINTDCTAEPKYVYEINVFKGNPRNLAEKEWGWYFHKQEDWGLYYTYEDALEGGLVEALTLIEKDLNFE